MNKKYAAEYFYNKFAAIPDNEWTTEVYFRPEDNAYCALGHCGCTDLGDSEESLTLECLFLGSDLFVSVPSINDGTEGTSDLGDTPKERILNALTLISAELDI